MSAPSVEFDTEVAAMGNNTGIVVPPEAVEALGAGQRPPVLVEVGEHSWRGTVAVMGGRCLLSVSAALRAQTGLRGGDPVHVRLTLATAPREVVVPPELAAALAQDEQAAAFFAGLSNSLQRHHCDTVAGSAVAQTRERRAAKAVALFREGRQR